jgi:hypothetical protein
VVAQEAEVTGDDQSALVGFAVGVGVAEQVEYLIVRAGEVGL